jgi:hypothetical protein
VNLQKLFNQHTEDKIVKFAKKCSTNKHKILKRLQKLFNRHRLNLQKKNPNTAKTNKRLIKVPKTLRLPANHGEKI